MKYYQYKNSYAHIFDNFLMRMSLKKTEELHGEKVT